MRDTGSPTHALEKLSDSSLTLMDPNEDIRDRTVLDRTGQEIGNVDDLLVDAQQMKVRFLLVGSGGFLGIGEKKYLIPVDAITNIGDAGIRVDLTKERATEAPEYQPDLTQEPDYDEVYGWYGYAPYWTAGYAYPAYPYYGPMVGTRSKHA